MILLSEGITRTRTLTAAFRSLPDFLIIGTQKGGTTSLYRYLTKHPQVRSAARKEIHFFDLSYDRGLTWYRSMFPLLPIRVRTSNFGSGRTLTGEASPLYLFHPAVPERVYSDLPEVRLIVLLRDPVDRAISHYFHEQRKGREDLGFVAAMDREMSLIRASPRGVTYEDGVHRGHSYLRRGLYAEQLQRWLRVFPRKQLLVLWSDDLFVRPRATYLRVLEFLELDSWVPKHFQAFNVNRYEDIDESAKLRVRQFFEPYNERLSRLLGTATGW